MLITEQEKKEANIVTPLMLSVLDQFYAAYVSTGQYQIKIKLIKLLRELSVINNACAPFKLHDCHKFILRKYPALK